VLHIQISLFYGEGTEVSLVKEDMAASSGAIAYKVWREKDRTGKWNRKRAYSKEAPKNGADNRNAVGRRLEYGDSYLINEIIGGHPFTAMLEKAFGGMFSTLISLCYHRIIAGGSMHGAEAWRDGNYVRRLFPGANLGTHSIRKALAYLGEDSVRKSFFDAYIPFIKDINSCAVTDIAGIPNDLKAPMTERGHNKDAIAYDTRLILALDKHTWLPMYYRYMDESIGNAGVLFEATEEMRSKEIYPAIALPDTGYYSEDNLETLFAGEAPFLMRIPYNEALSRKIIAESADIESPRHAVIDELKCYFVKEQEIRICGRTAFAYLVLNPERRNKEISKIILNAINNRIGIEGVDLADCGKMVFLSNEKTNVRDIVTLYYTRKEIARLFGISMDDYSILPSGVYGKPDFKGFMLIAFISMVIESELKTRIDKSITLKEALASLKSFRCDVFDNRVCLNGINGIQKKILERSDVKIPRKNAMKY
jgi:hypothetical protein